MIAGFEQQQIATAEATINLARGGEGPPVLLLHGFPQTHFLWRRVAPGLARDFTVVCTDLRGYGDSDKPPGDPRHETYSKRAMARDQVGVMRALGFERFAVVGHDRGARVAHRMALDHPQRVSRLAVLDIIPTRAVFTATDKDIATAYYHWFFLIQPHPLPERLIGNDPDFYLRHCLRSWSGSGLDPFEAEALEEYARCFRDPAAIHAACEDYRAGASIDLEHDEADLDTKIACPVLALWGEAGILQRRHDVLAAWRERAADVRGRSLPCGHFLPEEAPDETLELLRRFLAG